MRTILRLLPLILSALLLGAHFFRGGSVILAVAIALLPLLLLTRKAWAITVLQVGLFVAAAEWIRTAVAIGAMRAAVGAPSTRMFVILAAVALFTALAAVPLRNVTFTD